MRGIVVNNNEFNIVGLYDHNADSYQKIKSAFENGEDIVGIIQATGTGKSYIALQLAYDNKDKAIVYVAPSNGMIEHIKKIIEDHPNLDFERDFSNLKFRTYQSFVPLSKDEIQDIDCDFLILDEFHHIESPKWGARIDTMRETHPEMKIFGMTTDTVKDIANPDTNELFSGKVVSRYDLCDAMIDGVLPKPVYKSAYTNLINLESNLERRVQKLNATTKEYQDYMAILLNVKRRIQEAPSIPNILRKSIKPNGKYIYLCPPCAEEGTKDIETIKMQALEWLKQMVPEEDIVIYTSTNKVGEEDKQNRDAFYEDVTLDGEKASHKLRIMFAINQYNEGIHASNIDGVIMGRGITSNIVYWKQLGRALAVRGNTKDMFAELEKYSIEELIEMCKSRDIPIKENLSKEDLIEKLIAPVVIDLTNNYDFIKELENNLKDRMKDIQRNGLGRHRDIKIKDASFDIEIENQDLFEMLRYVDDRLTMTWEEYYELAKTYYEYHGNLEFSQSFKTNDGYTYDKNGLNLGIWIKRQRISFSSLSEERQRLLESIGFTSHPFEVRWHKNYELAKAYYEHYGNLKIPRKFKTNDGYTYDENGFTLGIWMGTQKSYFSSLSKERQQLLKSIGLTLSSSEEKWHKNYELAKAYYEHHGNLLIPLTFKTNDGYTYDENGTINLGTWIYTQNQNFSNLRKKRQQLLESIGFIASSSEKKWHKNYELAKAYYEHHGNLKMPCLFKTNDGYTYEENGANLGAWIQRQRQNFSNLPKERQQLLESIGFIVIPSEEKWHKNYELAKAYYEQHGNLKIPQSFKTNDGYTYDENGSNLGTWISAQRQNFSKLSRERQQLLESIGFKVIFSEERWHKNYELAKAYYEQHGNLLIPFHFKTNDGYTYEENGTINLGTWMNTQRQIFSSLSSEKQQLLESIGFILHPSEERWNKNDQLAKTYDEHHGNLETSQKLKTNDGYKNEIANFLEARWHKSYELAKVYYEHYGNLRVPRLFKTNDGYTYDENGSNLGTWIGTQRKYFSSLSKERQQLLESIGFIVSFSKDRWHKNYELAKAYYEHHGNLLISSSFKTNDGYTYHENGSNLGGWIGMQRQNFSSLSRERQQLLESIGFTLNPSEERWHKNYELAKTYYEHHGNLLMSFSFKTNDGYTYDENGTANLGTWIGTQRKYFSSLSKERQQLLESIGFTLNPSEERWNKSYELAKTYYEHYGNLEIPQGFKTNDGYTYDEKGTINLGTWIGKQRRTVLPESPQGLLLLQIGMMFNVKKNTEEINHICMQYNIDKNKNQMVLSHISTQELQAKIEFLKARNMSIVDDNGLLIDIFSMSSPDMKEKYGIVLEDLISEYSIKNQLVKGV